MKNVLVRLRMRFDDNVKDITTDDIRQALIDMEEWDYNITKILDFKEAK